MPMPAARAGDMHMCPMQTPGPVPVPHVGGPLAPMPSTVMIGKLPAATAGQPGVCVGPPDAVPMGSTTVLITKRPALRLGDSSSHGGTIVMGCPTVMIG
ncbi:PAAR domain-containing protein [Sansalvadorimonas sp. 2012CJ34-2]|uniref:PAAR domain-containing protein n=1 Tax=Parendozoicomonas callyspongiae TaxID=2942213 RepID=A0ABT0PBT6_9GAMM|nr:PAAR domain-containing protein [Sansalvadorimonas sp. 2012CJ34-2]MCL6268842.1 PAAR domain-containing protein [Sansalvadorimonas sp. 2012CJ34-2]